MGRHNIIYKNCIVCHKPIDDSFYDKSIYRPICSRSCYGKFIDNQPARYKKTRIHNEQAKFNEPKYEYPVRGKLALVNYNLNIW
jgi:endogenous inhibitor of DNA gyrase (YacG/DUF329 family)